jgi:hypothetical protein
MGMHFKTFELKEKHEFIRAMETFMSTTKQLALLPRFVSAYQRTLPRDTHIWISRS